ncbi:hypothetical protein C8J56DRAFT_511813 [Mycena floridula]|nr:hypothetical protein C8J56DRAFT_511813 [Mycena floridula]
MTDNDDGYDFTGVSLGHQFQSDVLGHIILNSIPPSLSSLSLINLMSDKTPKLYTHEGFVRLVSQLKILIVWTISSEYTDEFTQFWEISVPPAERDPQRISQSHDLVASWRFQNLARFLPVHGSSAHIPEPHQSRSESHYLCSKWPRGIHPLPQRVPDSSRAPRLSYVVRGRPTASQKTMAHGLSGLRGWAFKAAVVRPASAGL